MYNFEAVHRLHCYRHTSVLATLHNSAVEVEHRGLDKDKTTNISVLTLSFKICWNLVMSFLWKHKPVMEMSIKFQTYRTCGIYWFLKQVLFQSLTERVLCDNFKNIQLWRRKNNHSSFGLYRLTLYQLELHVPLKQHPCILGSRKFRPPLTGT